MSLESVVPEKLVIMLMISLKYILNKTLLLLEQ